MVAFRQSLLPIAILLVGCSTPRSEPRSETPAVASAAVAPSASVAAVPSASVAVAEPPPSPAPIVDAGGPAVKKDHFNFKGPDADKARAKARVAKALKKDAAMPNHPSNYSAIPDLDAFLKDHWVSVTPEGKTLKVEISPALPNPSWEMFFTVTADDSPKDITVAAIAAAPPPPHP